MTFLRPFEPLLINPSPDQVFCIDRGSDNSRARQALRAGATGLQGLIYHPRTPESALRGIAQKMWSPLGQRAVLLHREDYPFEVEAVKTRWSIVLSLDLANSPFQPIVNADREVVEANLLHLRGAGVDPGGTTLLYRDEEQLVEKLAEARGETLPLVSISEGNGARHRIWILSPEEEAAVIHLISGSRGAIVGDVALYRALQRLRDVPGFSPTVSPIVNCFNQRDFGVSFASMGILYTLAEGFSINPFIADMHERFEIREFPISPAQPSPLAHREFFDALRTEGITQRAIGLMFQGVPTGFLVKVPEGEVPPSWHELPEPVLDYDAEWVERWLTERLFSGKTMQPARTLADPRAVPQAFAELGNAMAVILNPPPKRNIPELADMHWRLPAWALQMKPSVPRGLFLAPLQPASTLSTRARS